MAVGTPTTNSASTGNPSVSVPAGVAAGDVVILVIEQDASTGTIGFPAGFTEFTEVNQTADGGRAAVAWKRLTGADSGTYTGSAGGALWAMTAIPLTGRHATDNPAISADSVQNAGQASGSTITANGVTAVAGDDILFISCPDVTSVGGGAGHSSWSAGYTEIVDLEGPTGSEWCNIGVAKAESVSAGATGTKTVTFTTSSGNFGWAAWLVRVPAAAGGGSNPRSISESVSVSDAVARTSAKPRSVAESVTSVSDTVARVGAKARTAADTITVSDAAAGTVGRPRTASDTVTVSDAAARAAQSFARAAGDTVTASDDASTGGGGPRSASESWSVSDSATRAAYTRTRAAADTLTLADQVQRSTGKSTTAADTWAVSDQTAISRGAARVITESWTLADAAARATLSWSRSASENIAVSDTAIGVFSGPLVEVGWLEGALAATVADGGGSLALIADGGGSLALIE